MAVSTYKHGVTWRDVPTSVVAPITADSGIPVAIGAAPVFMASSPAAINVPRIYYTYEEAVAEMGFSYDWQSYPLCEVMYTYFVLFNTGPIILVNVFDAAANLKTPVAPIAMPVTNGQVKVDIVDIYLPSVIVKDSAGAITYVKDTDYTVGYTQEGTLVINVIPEGAILPAATQLQVGYTQVNATVVDKQEIIGGVDPTSGKGTGLEVVDDVFPALAIVPGIILCPNFSQDPEVAAVMTAKADNVNGCFRCVAYADIDSVTVLKPQDVNAWKNSNNYVSKRLVAFWPRVALTDKEYWLSTQGAALTEWVDNVNVNIPVESPSNKNIKINRTIVGSLTAPTDMLFSKPYSDMLNGQGIVTALNWIGGWKLWGNNTTIYPSQSDPIDRWIPVRRMFDFIGNTIVLTIYQFVDKPGNRRLIDAIIDSLNIWLNSLVASGNSLGARVEFRHDENPITELLNGHYKFHVFVAPPIPAEWIEFLIEFDVNYLEALFTPISSTTGAGTFGTAGV